MVRFLQTLILVFVAAVFVDVTPALAAKVAAGFAHSVAVRSDGTVVAWGSNVSNQCAVPAGLSGVTAVAAGYDHTVALKGDGTVVAWGNNNADQCTVPDGLTGVTAIAAGWSNTLYGNRGFTAALLGNGTVLVWGENFDGQATVPDDLTGVIAIAAGGGHMVALKSDRTVVAWGNNGWGQTTVPDGLTGVIAIAAGALHTLALKDDGTVVAWGRSSQGQIAVPGGLTDVTAIAAGHYHSLALKGDKTVVAWGLDNAGQVSVPQSLTDVTAIAGGGYHSLAMGTDGTISAWGDNSAGQTASLRVDISPPEAVTAGARWSIDDGATWHGSETTLPVQPGTARISFLSVPDWVTPQSREITIGAGLTTITATYSGQTFTLEASISGTGGGAVNSIPSAISLTSGTVRVPFPLGSQLTLRAFPDNDSIFAGWSGDCSGTDDCLLTMDVDRMASARFNYVMPVRVDGLLPGYASLQAALDAAGPGSVVQARAFSFHENVLVGTEISMQGGYNSVYAAIIGVSQLTGSLTVGTGSLIVENLQLE